ncbi:MAG: hypothetical protein ACREBF_03185 [Candidatus Micrarchaeales archaeon]
MIFSNVLKEKDAKAFDDYNNRPGTPSSHLPDIKTSYMKSINRD